MPPLCSVYLKIICTALSEREPTNGIYVEWFVKVCGTQSVEFKCRLVDTHVVQLNFYNLSTIAVVLLGVPHQYIPRKLFRTIIIYHKEVISNSSRDTFNLIGFININSLLNKYPERFFIATFFRSSEATFFYCNCYLIFRRHVYLTGKY